MNSVATPNPLGRPTPTAADDLTFSRCMRNHRTTNRDSDRRGVIDLLGPGVNSPRFRPPEQGRRQRLDRNGRGLRCP